MSEKPDLTKAGLRDAFFKPVGWAALGLGGFLGFYYLVPDAEQTAVNTVIKENQNQIAAVMQSNNPYTPALIQNYAPTSPNSIPNAEQTAVNTATPNPIPMTTKKNRNKFSYTFDVNNENPSMKKAVEAAVIEHGYNFNDDSIVTARRILELCGLSEKNYHPGIYVIEQDTPKDGKPITKCIQHP